MSDPDWSPRDKDLYGSLMEAITGAAALVKSLKCEGRDNVSTLLLNWTGTPGLLDLPQEGTLRVCPYGDYEARLEGTGEPPRAKPRGFPAVSGGVEPPPHG
jgi:hypothetical protein